MKRPKYWLLINLACVVIFIGGILLAFLDVQLVRVTLISGALPFLFSVASGFLFTPLSRKMLGTYVQSSNWFIHALFSTVTAGSLVTSIPLAANYYLADEQLTIVNKHFTGIGETKHRGGLPTPYVTIRHEGIDVRFEFPRDTIIARYHSVDVHIAEGLLGIGVIKDYQLKK